MRVLLARLRPRSMRGKIAVRMVVILIAASAVLGVVTALFLRSFLVDRLDQQLSEAGGRYSAGLERGQAGPAGSDNDADNAVPGQSEGTVGVRVLDGNVTQAAIVTAQGKNRTLRFGSHDVAQLRQLVAGGRAQTKELSAVGTYRLEAVAGRDGDVQITGLPMHPVTETLGRLAIVEGTLAVVIVLTGGLASIIVVRRTMRPLSRLTATALEVSELPLSVSATELPRIVSPAEPTTEVDYMGVAFTHMLEHVQAALTERDVTEARLRRFVADASHELRTPLATIRAHAEYAARSDAGQDSQATVAEALARITSASDRMADLVADLLLLARLDAGRPLDSQPVDLTRLVLETVADAHAASPDHQWKLELPEEIVTVSGDEARLHQVLANLLSNARIHTPPGTTVITSLVCSEAWIDVSVRDNGPGIPLERQANLFDRFTRGDGSRSRAHGSSGLGLSIARGIVKAHGGALTVGNVPLRGTRFDVRLPMNPNAVDPEL